MNVISFEEFVSNKILKGNKYLICDSNIYGSTLLSNEARLANPSFGIKAVSVKELATEIGLFLLASENKLYTQLTNLEGLTLIYEILDNNWDKLEFFNKGKTKISLAEKILSMIGSLPRGNTNRRISNSGKLRDLNLIIGEYESRLLELKKVDEYDIFELAIKNLKKGYKINAVFGIFANLVVSDIERRFLNELLKDNKASYVISSKKYDVLPNIINNFFSTDEKCYNFKGDFSCLYDASKNYNRYDFRIFYTQSLEIKEVFKEIIERQLSLDEVEIVYCDPKYNAMFSDISSAFEVPINLVDGKSGNSTRVYRFLSLYKEFIKSDYSLNYLEQIESLDIFQKREIEEEEKNYISILRKYFKKGKEHYYEHMDDIRIEDPEREYLYNLLDVFHGKRNERVDLSVLILKLYNFINKYLKNIWKNGNEGQMLKQLFKFIEINAFKGSETEFSYAIDEILLILEGAVIYSETIDKNSILIRSLGMNIPISRDNVYILGMTSDFFPALNIESPILSNKSIKKNNISFLTSNELDEINLYRSMDLINGGYAKHIYFSRAEYDVIEGKELTSSIIFEQMLRKFNVEPKTYGYVRKTELKESIEENKEEVVVEKIVSNHISRSGLDKKTLSASMLETMIKCPLKAFFQYFLRLSISEEEEMKDGEWLSPMNRGNLIHKVLDKFINNYSVLKEIKTEDWEKELKEIYFSEVEKQKKLSPPSVIHDYEIKKNVYYTAVHDYLRDNIVESKNKVIGTEMSFGRDRLEKKALTINIGERKFKISGSIDMLELRGNDLAVIDFKSGSYRSKQEELEKNKLIQDYLYKVAIETHPYYFGIENLEEKEISGEYIFLLDNCKVLKAEKDRMGILLDLLDEINERGFISEVVRSGKKAPIVCTYCEYKEICIREERGFKV